MQMLLDQLRELQQRIEKNYGDLEMSLHPYESRSFEELMYEEDSLYRKYFSLIHENFTKEILAKVDDKIGYGKFLDPEYLTTLQEIVENEKASL